VGHLVEWLSLLFSLSKKYPVTGILFFIIFLHFYKRYLQINITITLFIHFYKPKTMLPIEQRLIKLEKDIRIYRIVFVSVICITLAFVLMSNEKKAIAPAKIQAKAFEVVDDAGNVLMTLNNEDDGGAITTYNKAGKKLTSLFTSDGGGGGSGVRCR